MTALLRMSYPPRLTINHQLLLVLWSTARLHRIFALSMPSRAMLMQRGT